MHFSTNLFLKYVSLLSTQGTYLHDFNYHSFKCHLLKFQHPYSITLFYSMKIFKWVKWVNKRAHFQCPIAKS